ncbi:MAG: hypothetical protein ACT4O6_18190 [Reyranella sp.]
MSLAAMGFLLSIGTAAAHGSHVAAHAQVAASDDEANLVDWSDAVAAVSPDQAHAAKSHAAKTDGQPCSEDQGDSKHATGCCTMACHAALAALPAGLVTGPDRSALHLRGISQVLLGRSGDRMERPPKLA